MYIGELMFHETRRLSILAEKGDKKRRYFLAAGGYRKDGAWVEAVNGAAVGGPCPPAHAEARCCRKLGPSDTVYVVRVKRDGKWGLAKPCRHCEKKMRDQGVKRVIYSIGPEEARVLWLRKE